MANQSVGKPRFYVDFTQLAKAKGFFHNPTKFGYANADFGDDLSADKNMNIWNFNHSNPTQFLMNENNHRRDFRLSFWNPTQEPNLEWCKLLSTMNWFGVINLDFASKFYDAGSTFITTPLRFENFETDEALEFCTGGTWDGISSGGHNLYEDGYKLFSISSIDENGNVIDSMPGAYERPDLMSGMVFRVANGEDYQDLVSQNVAVDIPYFLGSVCFGRYFDMPHSADLSVKKSYDFDGVKISRSLSGADYVQIDNSGPPDWVSGQPWSRGHNLNPKSTRIGKNGRRVWDVSFSYISAENLLFENAGDVNDVSSFGTTGYDSSGYEDEFNPKDEIQQVWDLTLGGALSFIFCPDTSLAATDLEFATCRFAQDTFTATQVAHNTWNISFKVEECW